ncbi:hypothetical protein DFH94DRAFT_687564 [Russula ochroleuca]|uniref:Uncharacterized protein n=1 Tax=Russula ochroleuca TaxID=152965 RepID=A0A9P5N5H9_9AGAM|nr:hypothetical protein DFH94DRAFT_687564 [Russula ochroleuca]
MPTPAPLSMFVPVALCSMSVSLNLNLVTQQHPLTSTHNAQDLCLLTYGVVSILLQGDGKD